MRNELISVGIDASNIGSAGGATHLVEILRSVSFVKHGIDEITVWGPDHVTSRIESRDGLRLRSSSLLNRSLLHRLYWRQFRLSQLAQECCDVLFVPGGLYLGSFRPYVTMMRNMLPFVSQERARYGISAARVRLHLLEWGQRKTFENAAGTIFLSDASKEAFEARHGRLQGETTIIPHGVSERFTSSEKDVRVSELNEESSSFRWLYVSPIRLYKHQWSVVRAVKMLREKGYNVTLDLVGHANAEAMRKLQAALEEVDSNGEFISYHGRVPHREVDELYRGADAFVFASTCETFGQVLTEAMQAGLPIACSNQSAAPEVVGDAGVYFDPEQPSEIADAMRRLMVDKNLRRETALAGSRRVDMFDWERCARDTFSFLRRVI